MYSNRQSKVNCIYFCQITDFWSIDIVSFAKKSFFLTKGNKIPPAGVLDNEKREYGGKKVNIRSGCRLQKRRQ